jgi:hypothetical protein
MVRLAFTAPVVEVPPIQHLTMGPSGIFTTPMSMNSLQKNNTILITQEIFEVGDFKDKKGVMLRFSLLQAIFRLPVHFLVINDTSRIIFFTSNSMSLSLTHCSIFVIF